MGPRQCQVCNDAVSKYKCPSCLAPYCSLTCFKKHKDLFSSTGSESLIRRPLTVDEPSEVLQRSQLGAIATSSEIRNALKDENLQKLISKIDCSPDAENELDKAMDSESFRILTDKILSIISP